LAYSCEHSGGPPFSYGKIGVAQEGPKELAGYVADHNLAKLSKGEGTFDREKQIVRDARGRIAALLMVVGFMLATAAPAFAQEEAPWTGSL
jgi:hypothetical protein